VEGFLGFLRICLLVVFASQIFFSHEDSKGTKGGTRPIGYPRPTGSSGRAGRQIFLFILQES